MKTPALEWPPGFLNNSCFAYCFALGDDNDTFLAKVGIASITKTDTGNYDVELEREPDYDPAGIAYLSVFIQTYTGDGFANVSFETPGTPKIIKVETRNAQGDEDMSFMMWVCNIPTPYRIPLSP